MKDTEYILRHTIRDSAFKLLFEYYLREDTIEQIYSVYLDYQIDGIVLNDDVKQLISGVLESQPQLDEVISKYSRNRSINRINKVDLVILRIAIYEILFDDRTPTNSAISEAVLLTQEYATSKDVKYVNGVLGSYSRELSTNED